jgi:hypothetical protein
MKRVLICCALLLAGCATVGDPQPIGPDTYMLSASTFMEVHSSAEEKAMPIAKANTFCSSMGKKMLLVSSDSGQFPTAHAEITFKCLAPNDPAFLNAKPESLNSGGG